MRLARFVDGGLGEYSVDPPARPVSIDDFASGKHEWSAKQLQLVRAGLVEVAVDNVTLRLGGYASLHMLVCGLRYLGRALHILSITVINKSPSIIVEAQ